ncbi:MAG: low molecular weight phosphotyrosine protein phosphatase [Arcanobacterium sp.]|nr:low molecular weight phosphotyrosine protein phosphatase [Arcanobacterium sp.]
MSSFTILTVCTGNICRSPMGEVVLRQRLLEAGVADVAVNSAGVSAEENGHDIDSRAKRVLSAAGYPLPTNHRAHRATAAELTSANLILAMTVGHARRLRPMVLDAGGDIERVHLWREFDGTLAYASRGVFGASGALATDPSWNATDRSSKRSRHYSDLYSSNGEFDVPDPWYGGPADFLTALQTIEAGAPAIVELVCTAVRA